MTRRIPLGRRTATATVMLVLAAIGGLAPVRGPAAHAVPGAPAVPAEHVPAVRAATASVATAAERYGWGTPLPQASDEFDYGSPAAPAKPDPVKWEQAGDEDGCWPGNGRLGGHRCAENSGVVGGVLRQVGETNGDTGWLASRFGQRYGRWEARVRSSETGLEGREVTERYQPLLILWPDSERWPQDGEYDYLENDTPGGDCAQAYLHYPHDENVPVQQEWAATCGTDMTEWHTIAIEWTPDHVRGYVDGRQTYSFSGGADEVRRCIQCAPSMHQTIQLDSTLPDPGTPVRAAVYEVDWVRTYALD
ncbi:glycoside hydrolase family 16 protein [Streptomyces lavenduligriseus]|uniref:Glycoside hydrolase family 16 protein n=1 Tax=Streptomyces lavenduligriseus TaxID=67315 RepID=A0ABT0NSB2_9ACTN|nr:glycoside hydrolase family 16 protein [Streptomyces lavenduligriseus]MCL3994352.1 glycoside hydrolase family 16 protein [Streptomyces lavenduligriseus]